MTIQAQNLRLLQTYPGQPTSQPVISTMPAAPPPTQPLYQDYATFSQPTPVVPAVSLDAAYASAIAALDLAAAEAAPAAPAAPAADPADAFKAAFAMLDAFQASLPATPAPAPAPAKPPADKPAPKPEPHPHARRQDWYISQYRSKFNTKEDVPGYDNANCGPTSLAMVAKAFGKINPGAAGADAAIEDARRRMGDGSNERNGTSVAGIARGAKSYGLDTQVLWNASADSIQKELAKGRLVIVHATVIRDDGSVSGGHYIVVTAIKDGKAYLNDSAYPSGPRVVSASLLNKSINTRGTHAMISVKG